MDFSRYSAVTNRKTLENFHLGGTGNILNNGEIFEGKLKNTAFQIQHVGNFEAFLLNPLRNTQQKIW